MILTGIVILPLIAGLLSLAVKSQPWLERLNLLTFGAVAVLAATLAGEVQVTGVVSGLNGFLYADALSALVAGLIAFVALVTGIYAIGYFREDERIQKVTVRQTRWYYRLTPFFVFAMQLVVLTNSLGVMWVAIEGTTLASVLLIAFYNEKTSIEAAWKYIIIGSLGISLALFGTIMTYYSAVGVLGTDASANGLNW